MDTTLTHAAPTDGALRNSDDALLLALETAEDGFWDYSLASGRFRFSESWLRMTGYGPEHPLSDPAFLSGLLHPEDLPVYEAAMDKLGGGTRPHCRCEVRLRRADGQWMWVLVRGSLVERTPMGTPLRAVGTHTDITDRKRTETALRESEALFRSVFDNAAAGIVICDETGRLEQVNQRMLDITGYALDEALGMRIADFEPEGTRTSSVEKLMAVVRRRGFLRLEYRVQCKSGELVWVELSASALRDEAGRVGKYVGVLLDITERKRAEEELTRALDQQDAILENSLTGIVVVHGRVMTRVNRRMADILGYKRSELSGKPVEMLHLSRRHYRNFLTLYSRHLGNTHFINIEYPVARKDGTEIWCRVSGKAIDRRNPSRGVIWCCDDVTEERRDQMALRAYAQELVQSQKAQREHAAMLAEAVRELDEKNERLRNEAEERRRMEDALRESELKYRELSRRDDLTGLHNTRHFYETARTELKRAERYGRPLSLLFMDIDDFKRFNDTYGHLEGDKVLRTLGDIIASRVRDTDSCFRYGGEEFIVLMPESTRDEAVHLADRVRCAFADTPFRPGGVEDHRTLSVGVAQYRPGETLAEFISRADNAMYTGKHGGKNVTCTSD